MKKQKANNAVF